MTRLAIRGGTVVTASDTVVADVLVEDAQVVAVAAPTSALSAEFSASAEIFDATGSYVIPGGIDVHTHFEATGQIVPVLETFEEGTVAAAYGGTTTIIDFAAPLPGTTMLDGLERYAALADGNCSVDYGFHMNTFGVNELTPKHMDRLVEEGVSSFKMFMAYPNAVQSNDADIFKTMRHAATNGALVMLHAENGTVIELLREEAATAGRHEAVEHALTRPSVLEEEAVFRATRLAALARVPVYIVHLSSSDALHVVADARSMGQNVFAETCPQYLFLTTEQLREPAGAGANFVCSPPLRDAEHHDALWKGLALGDLQVVATDHCPFCVEQKMLGTNDFRLIPNGLPGVEHRLELVFDRGVRDAALSLNRFVEIVATAPAKLFGLYPKKGTIAPGADADLVVFDPGRQKTISASSHHMRAEYSCYEGYELRGSVKAVWLRGRQLVHDGAFVGKTNLGEFQRRSISGCLA